MTLFGHVLTAGLVMAVIALSGALTLLLSTRTVQRLITPLVVSWLIPFAAGNFIYIAAVDLIPEVVRSTERPYSVLGAFGLGVLLMIATAMLGG